jgi:ABC-type glutathione transport system ATPase component
MVKQSSAYVEQEDALKGSLTVRETINLVARLALAEYEHTLQLDSWLDIDLPTALSPRRSASGDLAISLVVLVSGRKANIIVGTPNEKGLSGGQEKRLGVASRPATDARILFLDEPTKRPGLCSQLRGDGVHQSYWTKGQCELL